MPKAVDRDARTDLVVDSLFAVIVRDGLHAATLANIAAEAGLAIGSVRHYFGSHDELVTFAAASLTARIGGRLEQRAAALFAGPPERRVDHAIDLLLEVLPIDEQRLVETTVWLEFTIAGRTDERFTAQARALHDDLRRLVTALITSGRENGRLRTELDASVEGARLHALIDGLALHGTVYPDDGYAARARAAIAAHLESLRAPF
jgi:AcrR family transcriptional regulator